MNNSRIHCIYCSDLILVMRWLLCVFGFSYLCSPTSAELNSQMFFRLLYECSQTDWLSCVKIKLLANFDKFRNAESIKIVEGLVLEDEDFVPNVQRPLTERILENSLPRNLDAKNEILDSLIWDKVLNWISKYTLRWKLNNIRNAVNEGRGKHRKYTHLLLMPLMMVASFIPLALGTLAILAGKALIVGKMALLLTAILGIRKLFNGSHEDSEHQRAMKRITDFGMRLKSEMMMQRMAYRGLGPMSNDINSSV